jgi:hypothetical protein
MCCFAEELHEAGAELPQDLKAYRTDCMLWACMVHGVLLALVSVPKSCSVARGVSHRT